MEEMYKILWNIQQRATRKNRANSAKHFLILDLDYIAKNAEQALRLIEQPASKPGVE